MVGIRSWWASASGGNPQLVGIRNWRASTTVKKQRSPRNGARLGRARGIDTWNSGLIVGEQGPAGWVFCFPSLTTPQGLKERTHDSGTLVRQSQAIRSYMSLTGRAATTVTKVVNSALRRCLVSVLALPGCPHREFSDAGLPGLAGGRACLRSISAMLGGLTSWSLDLTTTRIALSLAPSILPTPGGRAKHVQWRRWESNWPTLSATATRALRRHPARRRPSASL